MGPERGRGRGLSRGVMLGLLAVGGSGALVAWLVLGSGTTTLPDVDPAARSPSPDAGPPPSPTPASVARGALPVGAAPPIAPPPPASGESAPSATTSSTEPAAGKALDLDRVSEDVLWARANAGSPDVGIPDRVAATEALLRRSLSTDDRVRALSLLAFHCRSLVDTGAVAKQLKALDEAITLVGPDSPRGIDASNQM